MSAVDEKKSLDRFSSVEVRGLLSLPSSPARDFCVAFALGSYLPSDGTTRQLRKGEVGEASIVTKGRRQHIMQVLNLTSDSFWRKRVRAWEEARMAHKCSRDRLCLFRRREALCPACDSLLDGPRLSRVGSRKRSASGRAAVYIGTRSGPHQDVIEHAHQNAKEPATEDEEGDAWIEGVPEAVWDLLRDHLEESTASILRQLTRAGFGEWRWPDINRMRDWLSQRERLGWSR
jgi:hypothetical protein